MAFKIPKIGTSYKAQGAVAQPKGLDREIGSSGGIYIRELVPELVSRSLQIQTYNRMARTDAVTSVSMRASKAPILGADFYFEPASDEDIDAEINEFVEYNIIKSLNTPFLSTLGKICRNFQDGTSVLEVVYGKQEWRPTRKGANTKEYTMIKKLAYRPTGTLREFVMDNNGGPVEIIQMAIDAKGNSSEVHIPIDKALVFPIGDTDDLMGHSLLRSAYPHWFYKQFLYKIDAIQKERHGIGIPKGTLPPGYTDDDKRILIELVRNIRTNEKAEVVLPVGYDITFIKPEGQLVDVLKSASVHDVLILMNVMAEFMMLGLESSGSGGGRATGAAQLDIFYKSLWYMANLICDSFNTYLIPKLVMYNYDSYQFPQMKVRNIGQTRDLQQLAAAMGNLSAKELIIPDDPLENWVRNVFDMPRRTTPRPEFSPEQVRKIINQSIVTGSNGASTPTPPPGNVPPGVQTNGKGNVSPGGIKGGGNTPKGTGI